MWKLFCFYIWILERVSWTLSHCSSGSLYNCPSDTQGALMNWCLLHCRATCVPSNSPTAAPSWTPCWWTTCSTRFPRSWSTTSSSWRRWPPASASGITRRLWDTSSSNQWVVLTQHNLVGWKKKHCFGFSIAAAFLLEWFAFDVFLFPCISLKSYQASF